MQTLLKILWQLLFLSFYLHIFTERCFLWLKELAGLKVLVKAWKSVNPCVNTNSFAALTNMPTVLYKKMFWPLWIVSHFITVLQWMFFFKLLEFCWWGLILGWCLLWLTVAPTQRYVSARPCLTNLNHWTVLFTFFMWFVPFGTFLMEFSN